MTDQTYYYVCDACAHVMPWPEAADEPPRACENCRNRYFDGPFDIETAGEISQLRIEDGAHE